MAYLIYLIPMVVSLVLINLMVFRYRTSYVSRGDYIVFTLVSLIPFLNMLLLFLAIISFWTDVIVPNIAKSKAFPKIADWLDTTINPEKK